MGELLLTQEERSREIDVGLSPGEPSQSRKDQAERRQKAGGKKKVTIVAHTQLLMFFSEGDKKGRGRGALGRKGEKMKSVAGEGTRLRDLCSRTAGGARKPKRKTERKHGPVQRG